MDTFFLAVALGICFLVLLVLYRVVYGPCVFNRVAAIAAVGT